MAECVASMMGNNLPMDSNPASLNQPVQGQGQLNPQQSPGDSSFPQLFASLDPTATSIDQGLLLDMVNPFAPLPITMGPATSANTGQPIQNMAGQTGNILPQNLPVMQISGYVGEGDQNGAAAISFTGDQHQLVATQPQVARSISPAIQQSQLKLHEGLQQTALNSQLEIPQLNLNTQARLDDAKQLELLAEMAKQGDNTIDTLSSKSSTTSLFAQALSGSIASNDTSGVVTSARSLPAMTATMQQPHWNEQIGDRLNVMISRGMQQAEIRLNPPELGMLEVKVQVQGEQANINFTTHHGSVKEALDAAIPRLREMLEENGLTLGDVNVSHQSLSQEQSTAGDESVANNSSDMELHGLESEQQDDEVARNTTISGGINLLDVFA